MEHGLLRVADIHAGLLHLEEERQLNDVDADGLAQHAGVSEKAQNLLDRRFKQSCLRGNCPAQSQHARTAVVGLEPGCEELVVTSGRSKVPDDGLAASREKAVASHLVAECSPDPGTRDVTDVVEIKEQQRAEFALLQSLASSGESIVSQSIEIDSHFEVHPHVSGGIYYRFETVHQFNFPLCRQQQCFPRLSRARR